MEDARVAIKAACIQYVSKEFVLHLFEFRISFGLLTSPTHTAMNRFLASSDGVSCRLSKWRRNVTKELDLSARFSNFNVGLTNILYLFLMNRERYELKEENHRIPGQLYISNDLENRSLH
jgi:hypothetical protein